MASELPLHAVPDAFDPDAVAIVQGGERWRWRDLDRRSAQWAVRLAANGVRADDLVAFVLPNGPEFLALTFGIYRAGATPAPLSPKLVPAELDAILHLMRPAAIIGDHPALVGRALTPPAADAATAYAEPGIAGSWKACTSGGSTGRPKVIVDARAAAFAAGVDFIGIPTRGRVFVPGPLYHNGPFSAAIFALSKGSTVVTMAKFDAAGALADIARERVDWAMMVPTMMHRILRLPATVRDDLDLSAWRMVVHTAAPMAPGIKLAWIERFGAAHVWEVYGATEGLVRTWIGGADWLGRRTSVGRPLGGALLRIQDGDGHILAPREEGEIFALPPRGPGSTYRYIGAERRMTADGWESVGDFGRLDADGYLHLSDRRIDLIISGGVNTWPAEIEAALLEHPDIRSCAVLGVADPDLGMHVHAVIEADHGAFDLDAVQSFLRPRLSPEKLPRSMTLRSTPVRDDAGKVRKAGLRLSPNDEGTR